MNKVKPGSVRIIAGQWRGRRIKIPDIKDLRPTPDRVRETLFNWLAPYIAEARCLDLYAGTGVLGFEALSRGAKDVVMVDQSAEVVDNIKSQLVEFKAAAGRAYQAELPKGLQAGEQPFDIVFIDPPYGANLLFPTCQHLEDNQFLAENALVYLEARETIEDNDLPDGWVILKSKRAGQVAYHLVKRELRNK